MAHGYRLRCQAKIVGPRGKGCSISFNLKGPAVKFANCDIEGTVTIRVGEDGRQVWKLSDEEFTATFNIVPGSGIHRYAGNAGFLECKKTHGHVEFENIVNRGEV